MRVAELLSGVQRFAIQFLLKRAKVRLKGLFRASTDPLFFFLFFFFVEQESP